MSLAPQLDADSAAQLARRARIGADALDLTIDGNDAETAAADLISDVLTAVVGIAGYTVQTSADDHESRWNEPAASAAQQLLNRAFASWEGDAEDYSA